jgi:hypothetical protein
MEFWFFAFQMWKNGEAAEQISLIARAARAA